MSNDKEEIGALWLRTSKNGNDFLSGKVLGVDVVCFEARRSEGGRGPTWRVFKSEPREDRTAPRDDRDIEF